MPTLGTAYLSSILGATEAPCVSIYLPTQRVGTNNQQDAARYRDLVRSAEEALATGHPGRDVRALAEKLHGIENDAGFWASASDGLVVLASPSRFDVFKLPRSVTERVEVGETFHVKPLIRHVQSADPFHVLGVSRERVALFDGNRYELHPLAAPGVPLTLAEYLGNQVDEPLPGSRDDYPARGARPGTRSGEAVSGGAGKGSRETDLLAEPREFFRAVDREVLARVSNPDNRPVILAGTPDNLAEFRGVSKNRFVLADEVRGDWTHWSLNEIREKAWPAFEKHYLDRLSSIREDFGTAAARGKGTADVVEAAQAAAAGRIGTLLVDADRTLPGAIEFTTGAVRPAGPADTRPGDLLDDLAELTLRNGGTVTVVPSDRMPTATGLAAIYRY